MFIMTPACKFRVASKKQEWCVFTYNSDEDISNVETSIPYFAKTYQEAVDFLKTIDLSDSHIAVIRKVEYYS